MTPTLSRAGRALRPRAFGLAGAVCVLGVLALPPAAPAEESPAPPRHAAPYGLDWLAYIAPEDLPPTRAAVCMVDSGLAITPDTPADSPTGPIVKRLAVDGGSGEPQGTAPEQLHGTLMSMAAVAPANDWGTVGIWPAGRVVSVRAMVAGETQFRADAWRRGVDWCLEEQSRGTPLAAINFSLGSEGEIPPDEASRLSDRLAAAHQREVSVVASAGNGSGAPIGAPARFPGVLAIAGGSSDGGLCPEASYDDRVVALGPACPVDRADPLTGRPALDLGGGSSTASAIASTLLAVLRTLRPDATRDQAETWIRTSVQRVDGRPVLDGAAAARAAGLGEVVDRARSRMATSAPMPSTLPSSGEKPQTTSVSALQPMPEKRLRSRLPRPVARSARWSRGRLMIKVRNRPQDARLRVTAVYASVREFSGAIRVRRERTASWLTMPSPRQPRLIELEFRPGHRNAARAASGRVILRFRPGGRLG